MELVTLVFQTEQTGTLMIFEHANIDAGTTHDYETGWKSTFDKLERTLKAGS
jgi:Activator of Hsp90 ATPase homolog 1-like protein.